MGPISQSNRIYALNNNLLSEETGSSEARPGWLGRTDRLINGVHLQSLEFDELSGYLFQFLKPFTPSIEEIISWDITNVGKDLNDHDIYVFYSVEIPLYSI